MGSLRAPLLCLNRNGGRMNWDQIEGKWDQAKGKIKDLDTLKANFPAIGKECGGCHETYRVKNS